MKNTTKQATRQPTGKATKAIKNRITAFLLALLLVTTVLSPPTLVKAQETATDGAETTENNSSGGTSAGAGDVLPVDPSSDASFTVNLSYYYSARKYTVNYSQSFSMTGEGHFNVRTSKVYNSQSDGYDITVHIFSDSPFTAYSSYIRKNIPTKGDIETFTGSQNYEVKADTQFGNMKCYYLQIPLGFSYSDDFTLSSPNIMEFTDDYDINGIVGGLDLSKDDYISEDQIADMTPVRDDSIGYLPRARYFDNRRNYKTMKKVTSTIQWASFEKPYASDLDNPYYVEIYADLQCEFGKKYSQGTGFWTTDTVSKRSKHHYKKYGDLKYVYERLEFSYSDPFNDYISILDSKYDGADIYFPQSYVIAYYVRLLHYDYEKQQLLCGGWTKLTPNENGGCTSETGDFSDGSPSDDDDFIPDDDDPKEWGDDGWEPDPDPDDPGNPDDPDFGIDTSSIGAFIASAITSFLNAFKSILSLVGEFPDLCKHVFSFLPDEMSTLMFGGVAAIIVMRFLGR